MRTLVIPILTFQKFGMTNVFYDICNWMTACFTALGLVYDITPVIERWIFEDLV